MYFELGNEPWGFWDPVEYGEVALTFAQAIKAVHPQAKVGIVGFPTTGNNQAFDPDNDPTNGKETAWTEMVQDMLSEESCGGARCFDFVTDHGYNYTGYSEMAENIPWNFPGAAAYYPLANWSGIFDKRLTDYDFPSTELAITEWNLKCWRSGSADNLDVTNPSFEEGDSNWTFWQRNPDTGASQVVTNNVHSGTQAMEVALNQASQD